MRFVRKFLNKTIWDCKLHFKHITNQSLNFIELKATETFFFNGFLTLKCFFGRFFFQFNLTKKPADLLETLIPHKTERRSWNESKDYKND